MRSRLLDLFCGAGMASDGYTAAGFDVTGGLSFDVNGDRGDGGRQLAQQQQQHQHLF